MRAQFAFHDRFEKGSDFIFLAAHLHLDATVNEISDPPGEVETFGDVADAPAETDTLNIAFVKNLDRHHPDKDDVLDITMRPANAGRCSDEALHGD